MYVHVSFMKFYKTYLHTIPVTKCHFIPNLYMYIIIKPHSVGQSAKFLYISPTPRSLSVCHVIQLGVHNQGIKSHF